jgi:hypothetical protein
MPPIEQPESSELLTRYLLGALSEEEAERLDERSIADDEFVLRLDAVESDLVDAFVRGDLSGESLERFKSVYLSTSKKVEKVAFAKALLGIEEKAATPAAERSVTKAAPGAQPERKAVEGHSAKHWFSSSRLVLQWAFATVALLAVFSSGYLYVENARLRKQQSAVYKQQLASEQQAQELEKQLDEQRAANAGVLKELERLHETISASPSLHTIAVLLVPPTRGVGQIPTVSVPPGTDRVTLRLQLEADDFPTYRASLKNPVTNQIDWRGTRLKVRTEGARRELAITFAVSLLKQQNYVLELSGVPAQGSEELLSSYAFKVVVK